MITNKNKNGKFFKLIQRIDKKKFMPLYEAYLSHLVFLTHILKLVIDLCAALYSVLVPIFYISA